MVPKRLHRNNTKRIVSREDFTKIRNLNVLVVCVDYIFHAQVYKPYITESRNVVTGQIRTGIKLR
ncbi:hypothetical protein CPC08DRAFT_704717 [Agrocybe pediades]|nr:hypothetical protein CPC08DRAFT_704717 [Agrocybe pediades]